MVITIVIRDVEAPTEKLATPVPPTSVLGSRPKGLATNNTVSDIIGILTPKLRSILYRNWPTHFLARSKREVKKKEVNGVTPQSQ
jgi:hypothetical protein